MAALLYALSPIQRPGAIAADLARVGACDGLRPCSHARWVFRGPSPSLFCTIRRTEYIASLLLPHQREFSLYSEMLSGLAIDMRIKRSIPTSVSVPTISNSRIQQPAIRWLALPLVAATVVSGIALGSGTAAAEETRPGRLAGQIDLLLTKEETVRAAKGDVWAAYSYCGDIIQSFGGAWALAGGTVGTALAVSTLGIGLGAIPAGAAAGGAAGTATISVACTARVIDAAKTAKSQGKRAGLTFQIPTGIWTWTY